jgi:hypothetical protein
MTTDNAWFTLLTQNTTTGIPFTKYKILIPPGGNIPDGVEREGQQD